MKDYYLAIDMGASGVRHILGHVENGKLALEEVYRFDNGPEKKDGSLVWNGGRIFEEIVKGLKKCREAGAIPRSIGIDTWGVDYALADKNGNLIEPIYAYRDARTEPFFNTPVSTEELYSITGIAHQSFNTIYQLLADKAAGRLDSAEHLLIMPEYFSRRLTGDLAAGTHSEYTHASTTGLLDARQKNWSGDLLKRLGLPPRLFKPIREPPYYMGDLSDAVQKEAGFNSRVVSVASHDTASAVAVASADTLYISSGTWSLLGVLGDPVLTEEARLAGYTNEGAHNGRVRFLKNIAGLWIIQSVRRELGEKYSFAGLEALAREAGKTAPADWVFDVNHSRFFAPSSMINEIKDEYRSAGMKVPETPGELAFCVYTSLANSYKIAIADLERITGKNYPSISIIGGGSKDGYLNALTASAAGKSVFAGPVEAAAIGNILLQMKESGDPAVKEGFSDLVKKSFGVSEFRQA